MKKQVTGSEFHARITEESRVRNCGVTTRYDEFSDTTKWLLAGSLVGLSLGKVGRSRAYQLEID